MGALRAHDVSGEGREDVLESPAGTVGSATQRVERTDASDSAVRQQGETVADLLGIPQLMNRQDERAAARRRAPQRIHHVAALSEVEAVERLVHQPNRGPRHKTSPPPAAAPLTPPHSSNA